MAVDMDEKIIEIEKRFDINTYIEHRIDRIRSDRP